MNSVDLQFSDVDEFIRRIKKFDELPVNKQIDCFAYMMLHNFDSGNINSADIKRCYELVHIPVPASLGSYFGRNSNFVKGKTQKYVKCKVGYKINRGYVLTIKQLIGDTIDYEPTNNLFDVVLLANTRGYIERVAEQAVKSYDVGLYDASCVMVRKLLEILIIELFKKNKIDSKIKNSGGNFFYLSDLISVLNNETTWNIGRNAKKGLAEIKKLGDMSAHSRRFTAKKSDLDKVKEDLRIVIEELTQLITY